MSFFYDPEKNYSGITMAMKVKRSKPRRLGNTHYKVENWAEYNEALRRRGDITLWISEDLLDSWHPKKSGSRGRPKSYSDAAIESCLMIRQVYHLPLRQTEGLIRSLIRLMDCPITAPDYTTLSKRSLSLELVDLAETIEPGSHMILDSTGLKVYGRDEWHQEKHAVNARRIWRKLHLAINENHYITASDLTDNSIGDPSVVDTLLEQVSNIDTVMADGAYDGEPTYQKLDGRNENITVIIPPPKNAVVHHKKNPQRNAHVTFIKEHGRRSWEKEHNYGIRSLVELAMLRYKTMIGPKLKARNIPQQKTEASISVSVLNRMTSLGMPVSVKIG